MSLLRRAASSGRYPQFNNYVSPLSQMYGQTSMTSAAGERIDEFTALGVSSVLGAVSLLADSVASMSLRCFIIDKAGKRTMKPMPSVLADPDPESNTYELIHQIVASMALHGNAYIKIDRDSRGEMIALIPLHPYQMQVMPSGDQTGRVYLHLGNDIAREDIIHLRWFTPPQSLVGISPLNQARNLVGLSIAMDRHLAQFYGEGGTPSSVLETDQKLTLDQARIIQGTWEATHRRHRRPAVLSDGLKWRPITTSAADNDMIATREQLIRDIARIFRIPDHLIGAMGGSQTYQNVEQASINFLTHTIAPYLRRIEIGMSKILPTGTDVAFDTSSILRVDALTRSRVNMINVQMGARTPNEVRQIEGLEPFNGGDVFHQSLMGSITAGGDTPALGQDADPSAPVMGVLE
jgi:HK97 family phage portal protein